MHVLFDRMKAALGEKLRDHVVVATDPSKGYLRNLVKQERLASFEIPPDVGGRFSALTPVGLLPAAMAGIDPRRLLKGAAAMARACSELDPRENPAGLLAAVAHALYRKKGKRLLAMMAYSTQLEPLADWFVQLWAESLGKRMSQDGKVVHEGQTPIRSVGARDQHSLIQLFNEGPNDKLVLFVDVDRHGRDVAVPAKIPSWEFLGKRKVSEILKAEKAGTEQALVENRRPNATLTLAELSPEEFGGLMYMLEMATVHFARLIGVNPFDQPGVEAGKRAAFAMLGKK
jgi:glucose-6-phosphate isomerase